MAGLAADAYVREGLQILACLWPWRVAIACAPMLWVCSHLFACCADANAPVANLVAEHKKIVKRSERVLLAQKCSLKSASLPSACRCLPPCATGPACFFSWPPSGLPVQAPSWRAPW